MALVTKTIRCAVCGSSSVSYDGKTYNCDENMLSVYLQTMAAAGDALVSAEKAQLHGVHPFQKVHSFVSHFCYDRCYSIVPLFSVVGKPELAIAYGSSNFLCICGIDMV